MSDTSALNDDDREDLVAYLDGELDEIGADKANQLESRLNLEAGVRAEADALKRTWDLLDYLPKPEASASFTNRTLDKLSVRETQRALRPLRRRRRWLIGTGWAAAVILAALGGYVAALHYFPTEPRERDLVRELRLIENMRFYEAVEPIADDQPLKFLEELARPELFGDTAQDS